MWFMGAKEKKGTWQQIFGNDHPIRIEVGMGKGQFILEQASRNPDVKFCGVLRNIRRFF